MGDLLSLIEEAERKLDRKKAEKLNVGLETFNGWLANLLFFSVTGGFFDQTKVDPQGSPVLGPNGQPQIEAVGFPFIVFILVLALRPEGLLRQK